MAITGKFLADFQSFYAAVQKAEVEMRGLETGAGKVERALNKMVDDFGGRKLIQDASLMAEAVTRVGGAATLTEREQRRVNAAVTEALAKYQALGQVAPKSLTDLAEATKQVAQNTEKIPAPAASAGASFKTLFGAFSAANLATGALTTLVGQVKDLAEKGLRLPAVETSFQRLSQGVGENSQEMLQSLQTATKGMVSEFDLMQTANKALLLGLPVTKESMGDMAEAAVALGRAMGQDATKSLDDLITALGRSSPMILDNLGLSVKLGDANEAMAQKLGKSVDALTEAEKKMAFYEAAMEAARKKTAELGEQSLTLSEQVSRAWTSIGNVITRAAGDADVGIGRMLSSFSNLREAMEAAARSGAGGSAGGLAIAIQAAADQAKVEKLNADMTRLVQTMDTGFGKVKDTIKSTIPTVGELKAIEEQLNEEYKKQQKSIKDAERSEVQRFETAARGWDDYRRKQMAAIEANDKFWKSFKSDMVKDSFLGEKGRAILHDNVEETVQWIKTWTQVETGVKSVEKALGEMGQTGGEEIRRAKEWAEGLAKAFERLQQMEREGRSGLSSGLQQLAGMAGGTAGSAIAGAGDILGFAKQASRGFDILGTSGVSAAAKLGAAVSATVGMVGVAYTASKVVGAILDKVDEHAGLQAQTVLRASDQLRDFNLSARMAGVNVDKLFAIRNPEAFAAAFEGAKRQIEDTQRLMENYGLTWRDFSSITEDFVKHTGRDLIDAFDMFSKNGVDVEKLLKGMSRDFNQLIKDAIQTGQKVPAGLRPILEQLVRTKNLSESAAAALLGLSDEGTASFDDVMQAADRYGIELDALGPKIRGLQIGDVAQQIVKDFELLVTAGGDVNGILTGMQDEVQGVVTSALKLGIALPESMRPIIEAMIAAGLLTDEFGEKLIDTSRISFAAPLTEKIDDLIDAIRDLIDETDQYAGKAEQAFGRARNAAVALGKAIPRGFVPSPETGGGETTPPSEDNRAVPRGAEGTPVEINVTSILDGEVVAEATARAMVG